MGSQIPIARLAIMTAVMLAALAVLGFMFERQPRRIVFDGLVEPFARSEHGQDAEDEAAAIAFSPEFEVDEATTIEVAVSRDAVPGELALGVALVDTRRADVRELSLYTRYRTALGDIAAVEELEAVGRFDRVEPGRYTLRLAPSWTAPSPDPAAPVPDAAVVATIGARSSIAFWLAALLLVTPLVIVWVRRRLQGN